MQNKSKRRGTRGPGRMEKGRENESSVGWKRDQAAGWWMMLPQPLSSSTHLRAPKRQLLLCLACTYIGQQLLCSIISSIYPLSMPEASGHSRPHPSLSSMTFISAAESRAKCRHEGNMLSDAAVCLHHAVDVGPSSPHPKEDPSSCSQGLHAVFLIFLLETDAIGCRLHGFFTRDLNIPRKRVAMLSYSIKQVPSRSRRLVHM